jgi:hypothetical protein
MYDYMLCKVTLGVLKGASKLNVLLLLLLFLKGQLRTEYPEFISSSWVKGLYVSEKLNIILDAAVDCRWPR